MEPIEQPVTIPVGYCQCGCGQKTNIPQYTRLDLGFKKGEPYRFIKSHVGRTLVKEKHWHWKGGKKIVHGYIFIMHPEHPRANKKGYVQEHIIIAEKALGKPLPSKAEIHHFDEIRSNNRNENLIICENHAYHCLLHARMRAYKACGNPNWRKCVYCKQYDDLTQLYFCSTSTNPIFYHRKCSSQRDKERHTSRKLKLTPTVRLVETEL